MLTEWPNYLNNTVTARDAEGLYLGGRSNDEVHKAEGKRFHRICALET
jgi:hypothetical protein